MSLLVSVLIVGLCGALLAVGADAHATTGGAAPGAALAAMASPVGTVAYATPVAPTAIPGTPTPSATPVDAAAIFADVPPGYWAYDAIRQIVSRGITIGCGDGPFGSRYYCPERGVTRAEMATFLARALGLGDAAPADAPTFADIPPSAWAYAQIEAVARLGITTGCGVDEQGRRLFCPDRTVTRAEMAAFLARAGAQGALAPAAPTFVDVPASYWAYGWVERAVSRGLTTGCGVDAAGGRLYCPDREVTRAEMAVFIVRAFP